LAAEKHLNFEDMIQASMPSKTRLLIASANIVKPEKLDQITNV
jgi:hypothetical protein